MLVPYVDIEVAVIIVVGPFGRLRRVVHLAETRAERDVRKGSVAIVAKKRVGVSARAFQPRASQDKNVETAVIVIVCLLEVQAAVEAHQPCELGPVRERPVRVVPEKLQLSGRIPRGGHDVEVAVAIEVVDDHSARQAEGIDSQLR